MLNPQEFTPPAGGAGGGGNPLEELMMHLQGAMQIVTDLASAMSQAAPAPSAPTPPAGPSVPGDMMSGPTA